MLPFKSHKSQKIGFTLLSLSLLLSFSEPSLGCETAACYGEQAVTQFEQIFGSEDVFIADIEAQLKPMMDNWMGASVAVAGFVLVLRSLTK